MKKINYNALFSEIIQLFKKGLRKRGEVPKVRLEKLRKNFIQKEESSKEPPIEEVPKRIQSEIMRQNIRVNEKQRHFLTSSFERKAGHASARNRRFQGKKDSRNIHPEG